MNKCLKILLVFFFAILLEIFYFQREFVAYRLNRDVKKTLSLSLGDAEVVNWKITDDGLVSEPDPMLIFHIDPMYVYNMEISCNISPVPNESTLFYPSEDNELLFESLKSTDGSFRLYLRKNVGSFIRIDLGEQPGLRLDNINIQINHVPFNPSLSRIIAVVLIYIFGSFLFSLQKMPDYMQYIATAENKAE